MGGGHYGLSSYANLKTGFVTNALSTVNYQLLMCGPDAATTPVVCTSGLEIEFYPNWTQNELSSPSRSGNTFPFVCNRQK